MQIKARDILFVINSNSGSQKPDVITKGIKNSGCEMIVCDGIVMSCTVLFLPSN